MREPVIPAACDRIPSSPPAASSSRASSSWLVLRSLARARRIPPGSISPTGSLPPAAPPPFRHRRTRPRDVLSRVIFGARISLAVAAAVVVRVPQPSVSFSAPSPASTAAGSIPSSPSILGNAFLALPGILLAVAVVAFLGPHRARPHPRPRPARPGSATPASSAPRSPGSASESSCRSPARLAPRTSASSPAPSFPHALQPVLVQATVGMSAAVLAEATLSFLGLGVQLPAATWGTMLNAARSHLFESPYLVFFPVPGRSRLRPRLQPARRRPARPPRPRPTQPRKPIMQANCLQSNPTPPEPWIFQEAVARGKHAIRLGAVGCKLDGWKGAAK